MLRRLLAVALAGLLAAPASAVAHGDPTAHYLETDALLTSYAAPPDIPVELQLRGVLDAAAARGYPIKVALFANENDTGGEPEPFEDPQTYVQTIVKQLSETRPLRAPVLIVTPERYGIGGRQPQVTDLALPQEANGNALARAAMAAVRRLSSAAGHPLPEDIPPAKNDLNGILADQSAHDNGGPVLIAAVVAASALLVALLIVLYRRTLREPTST
ncbi:hypothetical protein [Solirubrobacter soli]|uniref:hypothetical protein n=1 Tax=Solirubrobacter soli TaxID=363832 RepID=UPI0004248732|nr:hypothetical protein [Solirubrobacter soli]